MSCFTDKDVTPILPSVSIVSTMTSSGTETKQENVNTSILICTHTQSQSHKSEVSMREQGQRR